MVENNKKNFAQIYSGSQRLLVNIVPSVCRVWLTSVALPLEVERGFGIDIYFTLCTTLFFYFVHQNCQTTLVLSLYHTCGSNKMSQQTKRCDKNIPASRRCPCDDDDDDEEVQDDTRKAAQRHFGSGIGGHVSVW